MKLIIFIILIIICLSCNTLKKAQKDVAKISVTHPEVLAEYCADKFPVKEIFLPGDTIIVTDTLELEGSVFIDTVRTLDTIRITKTVTLPGQTITRTIVIHDTVIKENTAQLKVCELERGKMVNLLASSNAESDKWQGKAKKRFWILLGLIVLLAGSLYFNVRKLFG